MRELKNVVERAVHRAPRLEEPIAEIVLDPFDSPYRPGAEPSPAEQTEPALQIAPAPTVPDRPFDLVGRVREFERGLLADSYEANRFNQRQTADFVGMTYHQLRGYLKKHALIKQSKKLN